MGRKFYITTAIDYVNDLPHIGTAYEKVCADVIARFKRLLGYDVHFLMGNDEHSINVKREAESRGLSTEEYCDLMADQFQNIWRKLNISYDDFIRTMESRHQQAVQRLFWKIYDNGDIYKSTYEGWYCESCEAFLADKDLVDGKCANHQRKPSWIKEENYFFALSKYRDRLRKHIEQNPRFILPESRRNEILSLIRSGLEDVSVSRSSFDWGIPVPVDESHVVWVWIDALINYISALGYGTDGELFVRYWPADVHLIGKDIIRFHCVIWPAMLMSAGMDLPKTVFGHGFMTFEGRKMSKSLGHVIRPLDVVDRFGADALRYFLVREVLFGQDGDFSWERFIERYNADLANDLGNLVNRTLVMVDRYFGGVVPPSDPEGDRQLREKGLEIVTRVEENIADLELNSALDAIWELVREANRFIESKSPWELAKDPSRKAELEVVLYNLLESIRYIALLLSPVMPQKSQEIWGQLGIDEDLSAQRIDGLKSWGGIKSGSRVRRGGAIFPRIEREKKVAGVAESGVGLIDIAEFGRLDLRVAQIESAEGIKGVDKLLKLTADVGGERRQLVAGIAEHYRTDELIGRKIVVVANLKPATIKGVRSEGMLLAAQEGDKLNLVTVDGDIVAGAKVS